MTLALEGHKYAIDKIDDTRLTCAGRVISRDNLSSHRFDLNKPLIAAVGGVALGGGFEMALACDIIIASGQAIFGLPEPRVGLAALAGGIHRLPRQIGLKNAMGLMLTGRHLGAEEAERLGLVQEITKADELMERALSWADDIIACAQRYRAGTGATILADQFVVTTCHRFREPCFCAQKHGNR